jgi:hypothetical protein
LLSLWRIGRMNMEAGGREHRFDAFGALPLRFGATSCDARSDNAQR